MIGAATLAVGAPAASANSPIEGIWSFNGGKVGVQEGANGAFVGTVVAPTKFAQCVHPVGEQMWTGMNPQSDGSYWGFHQWYFATEACIPNPTLGLTAWRVLKGSDGSNFLRVCFSEPGSSSQPTIDPDGSAAGATFGCVDSSLVAPLPEVSSSEFARYVALSANKACYRRDEMRIRIHDPKNDPLKKIAVTLNGKTLKRAAKLKRSGNTVTATISLNGLSGSAFTVSVRLTTVLGDHLSGKRTYRGCSAALHAPRLHSRHR